MQLFNTPTPVFVALFYIVALVQCRVALQPRVCLGLSSIGDFLKDLKKSSGKVEVDKSALPQPVYSNDLSCAGLTREIAQWDYPADAWLKRIEAQDKSADWHWDHYYISHKSTGVVASYKVDVVNGAFSYDYGGSWEKGNEIGWPNIDYGTMLTHNYLEVAGRNLAELRFIGQRDFNNNDDVAAVREIFSKQGENWGPGGFLELNKGSDLWDEFVKKNEVAKGQVQMLKDYKDEFGEKHIWKFQFYLDQNRAYKDAQEPVVRMITVLAEPFGIGSDSDDE
ncbi:Uu.00g081760.m01.CDS01 [Anthostomella pinea]|uniref:Uu.00g081760.m01.CDS01 n=1 Tax=Anthostomella pinea TaxID=933095 RepID=A0AAI8YJF7_9PEZI|nr:Uu.00g081760.m01.CDS01 [Anthostomella pinea]